MPATSPCPHLCSPPPSGGRLEVEMVLDEYIGIAEAVVRCPVCDQHYLIELLDIDANARAYRLAPMDTWTAARLVRDLMRGSCDMQCAAAQVHAVKAQHPPCQTWISTGHGGLDALRCHTAQSPLPVASWRTLPLDGSWLRSVPRPTQPSG